MQSKRLICAFTSALAALATGVVFAQEPAQKAPSTFKPGTYTATVTGHNAPLTVTVTLTRRAVKPRRSRRGYKAPARSADRCL